MEEGKEITKKQLLEAENQFLKMKLMLERGAIFGGGDKGAPIPPEVENEFLKHVEMFESQCSQIEMIKVFDKIGKPDHFKPVDEIAAQEIEQAWNELLEYLNRFSITLGACNPKVSPRELYRFTTEELFEYEMDNLDVPDMVHCFIYDEFHPDPVFDTTNIAMEDCIRQVLKPQPLEWMHFYRHSDLALNEHTNLTREELRSVVNHFKVLHDDIEMKELQSTECIINDATCIVKGIYTAIGKTKAAERIYSGDWKVSFEKDEVIDCWFICSLTMEGINF